MAIKKEKIRALAERIVEHPEQFDMGMWFFGDDSEGFAIPDQRRGCQTAACYAGHLCLMDGLTPLNSGMATLPGGGHINASTYATKELGLTRIQAQRLFHAGNWPDKYYNEYVTATSKGKWQEAACIAAARLKHFCDTNGRE